MDLHSPESLRFILGLKLRAFRQQKALGLKQMAEKTGLSVSYLSEIEKGRKYPKPGKLLQLAAALEVPFDELVSVQVPDELGAVRDIIESPFLREFPFHLFGIELESILGLLSIVPTEARALLRASFEIGRLYGLEVEPFLLAALRSYQDLRGNFFREIEDAAAEFRGAQKWSRTAVPAFAELRRLLEKDFGCRVEGADFGKPAALKKLRGVLVPGREPLLLLNDQLQPCQQAFMVGRELGYRILGLGERSTTSPALGVDSFEQVINDFKAAYFSGAILLDQEAVVQEMSAFFARQTWSAGAFLDLPGRFETTPETFFYRLSQILPNRFGFGGLFFVRFTDHPDHGGIRLSKILNLSPLPMPQSGVEHHCRRWPGVQILATAPVADQSGVVAAVQRSRFLDDQGEYLVITLSRALSLSSRARSSVSLGLAIDDRLQSTVQFLDDPAIPCQDVHLTCERCPLIPAQCAERQVPPTLIDKERVRAEQQKELAAWIAEKTGAPGAGQRS